MTYREAIAAGYKEVGTALTRCYVSRKVRLGDQQVQEGKGIRTGQIFAVGPNFESSRYSIRYYLKK